MKIEDFWNHVAKGGDDDCWPWTAARGARGYGRLVMDGKDESAHRIAYRLAKGEPGKWFVRHTCDNRLCCNPSHLLRGTQKQNIADAMSRNRMSKPPLHRGSSHRLAVLTEDDVRAIRKESGAPADVARRLGLSYGSVRSVMIRRTWKWLS